MLSARFREYSRNYLRMRGEEPAPDDLPARTEELPPHARRRDRPPTGKFGFWGITSACAEKSWLNKHKEFLSGNYLRMRGEEDRAYFDFQETEELPPHARRRVAQLSFQLPIPGITSACAEKSSLHSF